jgi:hypothetical protein
MPPVLPIGAIADLAVSDAPPIVPVAAVNDRLAFADDANSNLIYLVEIEPLVDVVLV